VKQTPGALGYVELIYALQTSTLMARSEHGGEFAKASVDSVHRCRGGRREADARRLPRLDHQRAWHWRLSDLVVHLDLLYENRRTRPSKAMVDL